jgi:hypothetical protein
MLKLISLPLDLNEFLLLHIIYFALTCVLTLHLSSFHTITLDACLKNKALLSVAHERIGNLRYPTSELMQSKRLNCASKEKRRVNQNWLRIPKVKELIHIA